MKRFSDPGFAILLLCAVTPIASPAQTFTTLVNFNGTNGSGGASMVQGLNAKLYGVTRGGADGTIFDMTTTGKLVTLFSFDGTDGTNPDTLMLANNGDFYGTTVYGGTGGCGSGCGTIFKITAGGTFTPLYDFCSQPGCTDGYEPDSTLVEATNGDLYGTTAYGGTNNLGTIFRTITGGITTLHSFAGTDGAYPEGLILGADGDLYGTTSVGGSSTVCSGGCGTIFKITPAGALTTIYDFCVQDQCPAGGQSPEALIQATDGNFYGTTYEVYGYGTIFELTPAGVLTTLYTFCQSPFCDDGFNPGPLLQASDGNFYGTTYNGGGNTPKCYQGCGTIFEITTGGLTTLHSFDGTDGAGPGALVQATNGTFFGGTGYDGADKNGTIFSLSVGLAPFVETLPDSGHAGAAIKILGTDLAGARTVTFNGAAAAFTIVSPTEIKATVPVGATSGSVKVTTPRGTLLSNVPFQVLR
jgi:uncharacterized repeat protein (TIGR03803 family)